jgi:hypothetical protein
VLSGWLTYSAVINLWGCSLEDTATEWVPECALLTWPEDKYGDVAFSIAPVNQVKFGQVSFVSDNCQPDKLKYRMTSANYHPSQLLWDTESNGA